MERIVRSHQFHEMLAEFVHRPQSEAALSKSTAGRVLNRLAENNYLTLIPCT